MRFSLRVNVVERLFLKYYLFLYKHKITSNYSLLEKRTREYKRKYGQYFFHNKPKYSSIWCPELVELPYLDRAKEGCVKDIKLFLAISDRGPQRTKAWDYISAAFTYSWHTFSNANTWKDYTLIVLHNLQQWDIASRCKIVIFHTRMDMLGLGKLGYLNTCLCLIYFILVHYFMLSFKIYIKLTIYLSTCTLDAAPLRKLMFKTPLSSESSHLLIVLTVVLAVIDSIPSCWEPW